MRSRLFKEGLVGLFLLLGLAVFGGIIFFLKGYKFQDKTYQLTLSFENAGGLREGGRVFFRGVGVGRIVAINPSSNGVEVVTEIANGLPIPREVKVSTIRSGLLGDVSVNLIPQTELTEQAKQTNPLSKECSNQQLILCNRETINGKASPDLVQSLSRLADRFDDDSLFQNINDAVLNINQAGEKVSTLTDEMTSLTSTAKQDLASISQAINKVGDTAQSFSNTAESLSRTADVTSEQIKLLSQDYRNIPPEITTLTRNLNQVINENRSSLSSAIASLSETTKNVSQLAQSADQLVTRVNKSTDVEKIAQNIETSSANLTEISNNLLTLSQELNNPTNLVTLQQTLDSARVTFANTAKITSEIEEFTGDPQFRRNLKNLVNGLSNLVSYTEFLEKQVELATLLEEINHYESTVKKGELIVKIQK